MAVADAGRRTSSEVEELVIEVSAPTRDECLAQAVRALAEAFVDTTSAATSRPLPLRIPPGADVELLAALLEEVILLAAVMEIVPVEVAVHRTDDGGLAGCLDVTPVLELRTTRPPPTALIRCTISLEQQGCWTCAAALLAPRAV
jgi:hypothetical protein